MTAATGTTVDARAYSGDLKDVLRDVLADVLAVEDTNGTLAASCASSALYGEAERLRGEGMIDTARRIEVVVRALNAAVPTST